MDENNTLEEPPLDTGDTNQYSNDLTENWNNDQETAIVDNDTPVHIVENGSDQNTEEKSQMVSQ